MATKGSESRVVRAPNWADPADFRAFRARFPHLPEPSRYWPAGSFERDWLFSKKGEASMKCTCDSRDRAMAYVAAGYLERAPRHSARISDRRHGTLVVRTVLAAAAVVLLASRATWAQSDILSRLQIRRQRHV